MLEGRARAEDVVIWSFSDFFFCCLGAKGNYLGTFIYRSLRSLEAFWQSLFFSIHQFGLFHSHRVVPHPQDLLSLYQEKLCSVSALGVQGRGFRTRGKVKGSRGLPYAIH